MHHEPAAEVGPDNASDIKARVGFILFIVYSIVYGGFVVINTLSPKTMGEKILLGMNLAVVYGFGLIVLAIVMGVIYNAYCTARENHLNDPQETSQS